MLAKVGSSPTLLPASSHRYLGDLTVFLRWRASSDWRLRGRCLTASAATTPSVNLGLGLWLVGAGPGDPGLLTLLAYKSIKKADVIFYDALLDDHILSIAKPKAELVFVGKRGNKKSINQLEINKLLINEAKKNKRVLRLKGGDPFIFLSLIHI